MSECTIREATPADVGAIQRVAARGWREAYGELLADRTIDAAMEEWYTETTLRERIERDGRLFYVAVEGEEAVEAETQADVESQTAGSILGYVSGGPSRTEADVMVLGALYVLPEAWRSGIGTQLMDCFESTAGDQGYERIRFDVLAANEVGQAFYRQRGFEVVDTRETELFGEPVSEHVFEGGIE